MKNLLLCGALVAALVAPARADGPRQVTVGTYIDQIYGIDIKASQFTADFYLWFRWDGADDLKPLDTFEIANGRVTSKTGIVKKKIGNTNYIQARIVATFTKFFDMKRYPLDRHTLHIDIEDTVDDDRNIVYVVDRDNTNISPELTLPGFVITKHAAEVVRHGYETNYGDVSLPTGNRSSYSRYIYSIGIDRPGYGRFMRVFFGLFISVLISWCAFFVRPKESSPRVSLGVGATFAAAAVTVAINNSLPDTNLVTMADKLIMLTLAMIVGSVIVTITALQLFAKEKVAAQQKLDRVCSIVFPIVYLITLITILA